MLIDKEAQVANFNVVFGENEEPMLNYFDTIIYPAFMSELKRKEKDAEYFFHGVQLLESEICGYVLVGKIVKKTTLEVYSDVDESGRLIEKDERYSSAPYSTFAIYLKNHRMVLVKNQKGSPTLATFRSTANRIIQSYWINVNKERDEKQQLPEPEIRIVGIPSVRSMEQALKNVESVNKLFLCFYPLNGDLSFNEAFGVLSKEIRKTVGSKSGRVIYNTPKNISGIAKVLEESAGTIEPILEVTTKEKAKIRIRDTETAERYQIQIQDDNGFEEESKEIVQKTEKLKVIQFTNENHDGIYEKNKEKIIRFIPKR